MVTKLEAQLKEDVQKLFSLAESPDWSKLPEGLSVPAEIARREDPLTAIAAAKAKVEGRARARYEREKVEFDVKLRAREDKCQYRQEVVWQAATPPSATPL